MGGLFGRNKRKNDPFGQPPYNDPFYSGLPPPAPYGGGYGLSGYGGPPPYGGGYDPGGPYGEFDPYENYGYGYEPTLSYESYLGGPMRRGPNYGGRYGRGNGPMTGMSPWNYGNYYMGNTTMQMMPMMMRKVERYAQRQAMSGYGGGGGGGFGGMPMMPMMPMMPCLPAAPMMAAASPLPMACNPLVQNMYPMASMNPTGFMSPASFMSGLNTGPMPFRPPASIEFPSNVGMVMNLPYGSPNPMFPMSSFGGFSPQFGAGGGLSCCCCYCTPAISAPTVTYYPRPVCAPQACPVPVPVPVPIPNIQQVPVPRAVTVVAPPIFAGGNQSFPMFGGSQLMPSQGMYTQGGMGPTMVMGSNRQSTINSLLDDHSSETSKDESRRLKAQRIASSLSKLGLDDRTHGKTRSKRSSPCHIKHSRSSARHSTSDLMRVE